MIFLGWYVVKFYAVYDYAYAGLRYVACIELPDPTPSPVVPARTRVGAHVMKRRMFVGRGAFV